MNIKKKISVWCALFALLVALVPPGSAKAEEVDVDKLCVEACEALLNDSSMVDILSSGRQYVIGYSDYTGYVTMLLADESSSAVCIKTWNYKVFVCDNLSGKNNTSATEYQYIDGVWQSGGTGAVSIRNNSICPVIVASNYDTLYDTSSNIVQSNIPSIFEYIKGYSFVDWCDDAELNCYASSNESASVIPYSYNDYWHIVRKTSSGKWLLTTIGNSVMADNLSDYTLMCSEDMGRLQVYNLYSGEDTKGYLLNIRQYEYDADGWRLKSYVTEDSRDTDDCIIDLGAGSGVDDTRIIAYTSTDIYDEGFNLVTSASTEYVEPTLPEVTPEPTTTPSGGDSSDSGGTGSDGGGTGGGTRPDGGGTGGGTRPGINVDLGVDLDDITLEDIPETIKNIKDTIKEFFGLVGVVPLMIGAVFGFLPDWCLWVLGVSFAFVGILLVIKLIRG